MGVAPSLPLQLLTETHPSIMGDEDKQAVIDAKKAEVRARLEAQAAGKKSKKGFMTPERKKQLRNLKRNRNARQQREGRSLTRDAGSQRTWTTQAKTNSLPFARNITANFLS